MARSSSSSTRLNTPSTTQYLQHPAQSHNQKLEHLTDGRKKTIVQDIEAKESLKRYKFNCKIFGSMFEGHINVCWYKCLGPQINKIVSFKSGRGNKCDVFSWARLHRTPESLIGPPWGWRRLGRWLQWWCGGWAWTNPWGPSWDDTAAALKYTLSLNTNS